MLISGSSLIFKRIPRVSLPDRNMNFFAFLWRLSSGFFLHVCVFVFFLICVLTLNPDAVCAFFGWFLKQVLLEVQMIFCCAFF